MMIHTPLTRFEGQGRADPEFKGSFESLSRENKHIILETDDDDLVECTLQWMRMCNNNFQKKVMARVFKTETKEEEEEEEVEVEEEEHEPAEPKVPAPTQVNMECQTDESYLSGAKSGSSLQKEKPVPPKRSLQKEEAGETKPDVQTDDTAPKQEPAKRL